MAFVERNMKDGSKFFYENVVCELEGCERRDVPGITILVNYNETFPFEYPPPDPVSVCLDCIQLISKAHET